MALDEYMEKAKNKIKEGADADNNKQYEEAFQNYTTALDYILSAIKYTKNQELVKIYRIKMAEVMTRAEKVKEILDKKKNQDDSGDASVKLKDSKKQDKDDLKLEEHIHGTIVKQKSKVKWEDVAGLTIAKKNLEQAVVIPLKFSHLFTENRKAWKGILMYGPPGTGKTFLAKAISNKVDSTFFSISAADIMSKWLGESERHVRVLFKMARECAPSIIFIDEIDALCSSRGESEHDSVRRVKSEFLVQMDGITDDDDSTQNHVLILGATNLPWNLDMAIRRRFERRIYIPLPDDDARQKLFKIGIGRISNTIVDSDYIEFAKLTQGYSGADINILCRMALFDPINILCESEYFRQVAGIDPETKERCRDLFVPCTSSDKGAVSMRYTDIKNSKKIIPTKVTRESILKALMSVKPSVAGEDLQQYIDWTTQYGVSGQV